MIGFLKLIANTGHAGTVSHCCDSSALKRSGQPLRNGSVSLQTIHPSKFSQQLNWLNPRVRVYSKYNIVNIFFHICKKTQLNRNYNAY